MTFDPNLGRWMEDDPISFDGGDVDLYRAEGNNPINHTDPSGEFYLTKMPDEFIKRLKDAGIDNPRAFKLPSGYYYIHTTDRDTQVLFKIADEIWGKQVFDKNLYGKDRKSWEKAASARNAFLFAGGAAGGHLRGGTHVDPSNNSDKVELSQIDRQAILSICVDTLEEPKKKHLPLIVDVGGSGRNTQKDGTPVINLNRSPFVGRSDTFANFIYGDGRKLPFRTGSVEYLYYENMFAIQSFVDELVRVAMPGGTIRVYGATEGVKILRDMFMKANGKITLTELGDYLNTGVGDGFDAKVPKK